MLSIEAQIFITVVAVLGGVTALARAVLARERGETARAVWLVVVFAAAMAGTCWMGVRPVHEPQGCQTYMQTRWVNGVETTRCMPRDGGR